MAERPVFISAEQRPFGRAQTVKFTWFAGLSKAQKQRSLASLHESFLRKFPDRRVLEISGKSTQPLGVALSAFNLKWRRPEGEFTVENLYQAGKVFSGGGPYTDLLTVSPRDAKRDERLKTSGRLTGFRMGEESFPLVPASLFYNWLYLNALHSQPALAAAVMEYDAFTDIEFNPNKSVSCQAQAAAIYVALAHQGLVEEALRSRQDFLRVVYGRA